MKRIVVRCEGNGDVAVVEIGIRVFPDQVHLAEVVPTADPMVQRRVNHEVLNISEHPELVALTEEDELSHPRHWYMQAVESLALGYLNRQNNSPIRLNQDWENGLSHGVRSIS